MRSPMIATILLLAGALSASAQSPIARVAQVTIVVRDQDEALKFYVDKLGFEKREDQTIGRFRWLTVALPGQRDLAIVLEKPSGEMGEARQKQLAAQIGQAPAWVFETADVKAAYETLKARGVEFVSPPQKLPYGTQAVMRDLYGNSFALVERPGR
jgi:predicted enzyme related to lactoylglutathione lyase